MEGFTYTDIFDTKGIEYLIIIAFLILLIPFWFLLNKGSKIKTLVQDTLGILTANILKIPQGLFFCKNHTWTHLEQTGLAKVGLDDFLIQTVGQVKINTPKVTGQKINKGDLLLEIMQNDKHLEIYSPISGEIQNSNSIIHENPGVINDDPYNEGWIYSIKPSNWIAETKSYYLADKANTWINGELTRLKDFLAISIGKHSQNQSVVALQEGGELRVHVLSEMQNEIWLDFQEEFLTKSEL